MTSARKTALLIVDVINRLDFEGAVPRDCSAAESEADHEAALQLLENGLGVDVRNSTELDVF